MPTLAPPPFPLPPGSLLPFLVDLYEHRAPGARELGPCHQVGAVTALGAPKQVLGWVCASSFARGRN